MELSGEEDAPRGARLQAPHAGAARPPEHAVSGAPSFHREPAGAVRGETRSNMLEEKRTDMLRALHPGPKETMQKGSAGGSGRSYSATSAGPR